MQRGIVHLIPLLLIGIVIVVVYLLFRNTQSSSKNAEVPLKAEYQNPLTLETQYTNPFSEYKNPFDTLK